jgi:hypothetical protein
MYETFMNTVRQFFTVEGFFGFAGGTLGEGKMRLALLGVLGLVILGLLLWVTPAYRRWARSMTGRGGWRSILVAVPTGVFKLLVVFMIVRFTVVALGYQARVFEHENGRVTERNRASVLMKWGQPHEQRELQVQFTKTRLWVTRQLKIVEMVDEKEKEYVTTESFWKDDEQPVQPVAGRLPVVLTTHEEKRDVPVEQRSITSAEVDIALTNSPRELGGAMYAGYEDAWSLKYQVANEQAEPVVAHFRFPRGYDMDQVRIAVDGRNILGQSRHEEDALAWDMEMAPGKQVEAVINYTSRGLEHLRYIPRRGVPTAHYRVAVTVEGVPAQEMNYAEGSMPAPGPNLADISETPFTLRWTLDNAITSKDIGLRLPTAKQPKYHITTLLNEAPTGLFLLVMLLLVPRFLAGRTIQPAVVGILVAAYYLFYTFLGRLTDVDLPFAAAFSTAAATMVALAAFFRSRDREGALFLRVQDILVFAVLTAVYPLAVISEWAALWMQGFYIAALLYVCALVVGRCLGVRAADDAASPPA